MVEKLLYIYLIIIPLGVWGQFYNGHQMEFGKNRVQYGEFYWQYYRYSNYDIYFSEGGRKLAHYVEQIVDENIDDISEILNVAYDRRIIFIVYNTLSDFKQSNIGLSTSEAQYNIGGTTQIIGNKVILYFDGNHIEFEKQLRYGLASLFVEDMLYGTQNVKQLISRSVAKVYPDWFQHGLASYIAYGWSPNIHDIILSEVMSGSLRKINKLDNDNAEVAGHAIFSYIAENFGENTLANIIYLTKITKDPEKGFYYVLGLPLKHITKDVNSYYKNKLLQDSTLETFPTEQAIISPGKRTHILSPTLSPDGTMIVYAINEMGKYKVYLKQLATGKTTLLKKDGYKLKQETDYSFPIMTWHPTGKLFAMFYEDAGKLWFSLYDVGADEFIEREFFYFDKVLSAAYSHDGYRIVFSGLKNGQTDIWVHTIASHTNEQITNDLSDDILPQFTLNDEKIIFSSNRLTDSCKNAIDSVSPTFDLYEYRINSNRNVLDRISNSKYDNETYVNSQANGNYIYLNDNNGIRNIFIAHRDSSVEAVDTAIHYRKFLRNKPITNNSYNIRNINYSEAQRKSTGSIYNNDGFNLFNSDLKITKPISLQNTFYKDEFISAMKTDSAEVAEIEEQSKRLIPLEEKKDTAAIDVNNYVFEIEKFYSELLDSIFAPDKKKPIIPSVYQTSFYINEVVNQVDFGFLNSSYQPFTGDALYYSPGINLFFQFGIIDLFEDYRLTGGFRIAGSFDSNELLLSFENLKKRYDKQVIYHRKSLSTIETATSQLTGYSSYEMHKVQDHELMYIVKYPFDQVQSLKITPSFRYDKDIRLAHDNLYSLDDTILHKYWGGLKAEYVFDNSLSKGLNLYNGIRAKVFFEYYHRIDDPENYLFVFGVDYRKYIKIHRNIIWANRFAYSSGFGTSPLLYYLGSVDNWINIFSGYDTYNEDIEYDKSVNWAYQALATNMRGFNQNIRNGTSFALINSELRVPIISYIANQPLRNEFLNNFQIVGFSDIGSAWYGIIPGNEEEAYNYKIIETEPITVIIDKNYSPLVLGYGFGLRSKVFGYFLRADWAWGIDRGVIMDNIFYLSLSLDF